MHVIAELPQSDLKATIYGWNGKYLIKFETALYEQTYKIKEMDVNGEEEIKALLQNEEFMKKVRERFKTMSQDFYEALEI
ncbi:MAG: hypothetical protein ACJ75J_00825 [Cytophagaceae bacterium]